MKIRTILLFLAVASSPLAQVTSPPPSGPAGAGAKQFRVEPTSESIRIDGVLDEQVWQTAQPMELDVETTPGENIPPTAKTTGYMTFDAKHLYVAIRAFDPDPSKIRAHLSDRDTAFSDDFVGVVLDTFNDDRRAFEFFVNPLGVQMDLIQDDINRNEDASWDAIWSSAGRIDTQGYVVEMAIPFTSLRFPKTDGEQTWGVDMVRVYPRSQRQIFALQPRDRNRNCALCQSSRVAGFRGITPGRDIELDPTITAQQTSRRAGFPAGALRSGDADFDAGLTARWGITPNLQLNAAINPDFSQIEADSVQLDINRQFALFFNEKRPFFLEGSDFFETPISTVYTRTVADPAYGLKVTGRLGAATVGAYVAEDEVTNILIPGVQGSGFAFVEEENRASVFRYRHNIGKTSSIGAIFTNRDAEGYANTVFGADGTFRVSDKDTIVAQLVGSSTDYPAYLINQFGLSGRRMRDVAGRIQYRHSSRNWFWGAMYEDIGTDFRADSGFVPQVGYRVGNSYVEYQRHGERGKDWYTRILVGGDVDRSEEQNGELLEQEVETWFAVQGPLQSFFRVVIGDRDRRFNGVTFDEQFVHMNAEIRPVGDFFIFVGGTYADQIDFANTRPGKRNRFNGGIRWNIGRHAKVDLDQSYENLDVRGGQLFAADVTQLRAVYQFNIRTFVRAILQYTDVTRDPSLYLFQDVSESSKRLFPQLLFSYKLNPQTVFFAGYSGTSRGGEFDGVDIGLTESDRTFFLKLGYAWLF